MYNYGFDFFSDPDFLTFLAVVLPIIGIFMFMGLLLWIFQSIGLYTLAKKRGMSAPGLAWIPIIGIFRVGSIADDISEKNGGKSSFRFIILFGYIISWLASGASYLPMINAFSSRHYDYDSAFMGGAFLATSGLGSISWLLGVALYIITIVAANKVFKCYRPGSSAAYTVLSAIPFTSFLMSIFLFIIRNDEPAPSYGQQGGYYPPQYAPPPYNPGQPYNTQQPGQYAPPPYNPGQPYNQPPQQYAPPPPEYRPQQPQQDAPPPPPEYRPEDGQPPRDN